MKQLYSVLFLAFLVTAGHAQTQQEDTIISRYKQYLFITDTSTHNLALLPPLDAAGRWADIDYTDQQPGGWQPSNHMRRVRQMAFVWADERSPRYHDQQLLANISLALNDWFNHRYKSKNWWHNEIGVPQLMRDVTILLQEGLTPTQRQQCLEILNQHKVKGTGANLVWSADLGLHYGALTHNQQMMRHCRDTIITVLKISTEEGVQPDFSFHQHGRRLQVYHYGGAFLIENVRLAWQLAGTPLAFPPEKTRVLTGFALKGWQWMARGINTVPGTIDRAASRQNALHSADIRRIIPLLYQVQPDSIAAFKKMLDIQNGKGSLNGYRYYPYSDFTAYHQPGYSFFLKTNSTRTLLTESINEENLKGALLNAGDSYFISNGNEYFNLMPFWDWNKLPGITNFESATRNKIVSQNFVGNISDGTAGAAVMEHVVADKKDSLFAKKFWASWRGLTVALITGLRTTTPNVPVFTVLDQSRLQGKVMVNDKIVADAEKDHLYKNVRWIHHNKFVYVPLYNDSISLQTKTVAARWYEINHSESRDTLHEKVFMPSILHHSAASGYVVGYAPTTKQASAIAKNPAWKILQNNTACQAVQFNDGALMAAIYTPGSYNLLPRIKITTSKACLIMLNNGRAYASDPSHSGGTLTLSINDKRYQVTFPADGTTVQVF